MKRLVIITVGKTHSGKTTFAKILEQQLPNSLVIDQDNHAEFINACYQALLPKKGPNAIKYAITQTIVNYAVQQTDAHLILCNSNLARQGRLDLLAHFRNKGFESVLVHFDIPDHILQARVADSQRSKAIFRSAASFEEVLIRQQAESHKNGMTGPLEGEADHLFVIRNTEDVQSVIQSILQV
ncbi:ATP-binding protein [Paenibacillus chondroitinus]|uniref:ATP-binding protein n=1 Tax=Paenibacillus chondroitinus TaxID=59842 RepID=A0ABU6D7B0_9BACL|nr:MULTISPECIES: ATP-binding protein [Paenibacillus]MCY9658833.1 ATP-binding protein [Paenibacillus anseongense]MEB4792831.1 ATP-binding protein [Paenibacillus chondroitinus]